MAILSDKAPRDILTGQDSVIDRKTFFPPKGLPITKMNSRQKKAWLAEIVEAYAAKHRPEVIEQVKARNPLLDPEQTYFVWMGSQRAGEGHYYRIQTPKFLFEYDSTQNDANHVHAVWHGLRRRFRSRPAKRTFGQGSCPRQGLGQYVRRQDSQGMESK